MVRKKRIHTARKPATKLRHKTRKQKGGGIITCDIEANDGTRIGILAFDSGDSFKTIFNELNTKITSFKNNVILKKNPIPLDILYIKPHYSKKLYILPSSGDPSIIDYLHFRDRPLRYQTFYGMRGDKIIATVNSHEHPDNITLSDTLPTSFDANKVYTYLGHGSDEPKNSGIRIPMPQDCVYITVVTCGMLSDKWGYFLKLFASKDPYVYALLNDPIRRKDELIELFSNNGIPDIHIHYANAAEEEFRSYTEAVYSGGLTWSGREKYLDTGGQPMIAISGLHKHANFDTTSLNHTIIPHNTPLKTLHQGILDHYTKFGSHIEGPILDEIRVAIDESKNIDDFIKNADGIKVSQSYLFDKYPGVHYNAVCRAVAGRPYTRDRRGSKTPNEMKLGNYSND